MNLFLLTTLFCLSTISQTIGTTNTNLVLLQVIARHGVRSVLRNYQNDPNQAYWDTYGVGQLLPVGMKQLQDYGVFIANRYANFLNTTYSSTRVYARSTSFDRTLQSAAAFLSGAYKPKSFQMWTNRSGLTNWLPISIHTNDLNIDKVLHLEGPCARYTQLKKQARNSSGYLNNQRINKEFFAMLSNFSGIADLDQSTISTLFDKFISQETIGLPSEKYLVDNSEKILDLFVDYYNYIVGTEMAKLVSGGLLNEIINNMKSKISDSSQQREFFYYSIHDTYVAAVHKLLNPSTNKFFYTDFASGYVFELRNDTQGNHYVQLFLKNDKPADPVSLQLINIEGCDTLCPLDRFAELLKDGLVSDYDVACKEQDSV